MPGMMSGSNSQSTSKGTHSNMTANLQHNLLLQQGLSNSQLGQMPQGYSPSTSHNLHNVPPLHHYDMDAYQNL